MVCKIAQRSLWAFTTQYPAESSLVVWEDSSGEIRCTATVPTEKVSQMAYFLKTDRCSITPTDDFDARVHHGTVRGESMDNMVTMIEQVFMPLLEDTRDWPRSVQHEFASRVNKFMSLINGLKRQNQTSSELFIPRECGRLNGPDAAMLISDHDYVQRMETIVIEWTRQIQDVVAGLKAGEEVVVPLEEIAFWRARCDNMSGLGQQLKDKRVDDVVSLLDTTNSPYVATFRSWCTQIQEGITRASSNLKFLSMLEGPCSELQSVDTAALTPIFYRILNLIKMISIHAPFYNTTDHVNSLVQQVTNSIIARCSQEISVTDIFEGDVSVGVDQLERAIKCCDDWMEAVKVACALHEKKLCNGAAIEPSAAFAEIDAFKQRCQHLLDVCSCASHFGRRKGKEVAEAPCVRGSASIEVRRTFESISDQFYAELRRLYTSSEGRILDTKFDQWHDIYNVQFKSAIKDLEVLSQNLLNNALRRVSEVDAIVELLEVFKSLADRDIVRRAFDQGTEILFGVCSARLATIKKLFSENNKEPPIRDMSPSWPDYAGNVMWADGLLQEVQRLVVTIRDATFLPPDGNTVLEEADHFVNALKDYSTKLFKKWYTMTANCSDSLLAVPLMTRSTTDGLTLVLNFNHDLLNLFQEIRLFNKLGHQAPPRVNDLFSKQEDLRCLREHVLLVVRDYNSIIEMLSDDERKLFKDRIRFVDKKIQPGLKKLTWSSKGISEFYVADSRSHASSLRTTVETYLNENTKIAQLCHAIGNLKLTAVEERKQYSISDFVAEQMKQVKAGVEQITKHHSEIVKSLKCTRKVFANDGHDVQSQWTTYVKKIDEMLESSIKLCVKKSLQRLAQVVNGDKKSGPQPAFKIYIALDDDAKEIQLDASYDEHRNAISELALNLSKISESLPRLSAELTRGKVASVSFSSSVSLDPECRKLIYAIKSGFENTRPAIGEFIHNWEKNYKDLYSVDKKRFMERYEQSKPSLVTFEADTARYDEKIIEVQKEETLTPVDFVLLDSAPLKRSIVNHCTEWRNLFTHLLYQMAESELRSVTDYLEESITAMKVVPTSLEQMIESIQLVETTQAGMAATEQRFDPIHDRFAILARYDVPSTSDVTQLIESLPTQWTSFKDTLDLAVAQLEESKVEFKTQLLREADELTIRVSKFRDNFKSQGPYGSDKSPEEALDQLKGYRESIAAIRETEGSLRSSLSHFGVTQESFKEISDTEADLTYLDQLWGLAHEFETSYLVWSDEQFMSINTEDMEQQAAGRLKKLVKLNREVKNKGWDMVQFYRNKLTTFKETMPLIQDLKNPAMRERHWDQLMEEVGKKFDPTSDQFTLGTMIALELDNFADQVSEISGAASKELQIEESINTIVEVWKETAVEIRPYKDGSKGHFLLQGNTDDLYALLEDNQVTISTMKASRFVKPFADDVDFWERTLAMILEIIDMVLTVQRQWMYLENIFQGEDIRKQLPKETLMFDDIDLTFKGIMTNMNSNNNAQQCCSDASLLKTLEDMNEKLELIQKALDQYLEAKRQLFPRFYFVSNDDLLEILGQSRNPKAVMPHMLKCFDNIKSLELVQPAVKSKPMDAVGMFSADGEFVPFSRSVSLDGAVEFWLTKVEDEMRNSLRAQMSLTKDAHKKTKREKWIADWPGQLVIAISQLAWTADTVKAISGGKKKEKVSAKKGLKSMKKKQVAFLKKLIEAIRAVKNKVQKKKLVGLITIEVHSRDVLEKLAKLPAVTPESFDWLMQLRYYWEKTEVCPDGDVVVRQTNTRFTYMYEYLGNSGRLVITPLTDRCYMTLTTALHLNNGGSPKGPAGTGKTETTKDLGKALGAYVIVVNCSEGLDYKSIGRMFSGLAQTGAWGCFDEFNRINIEVLSVVAQQVLCILAAIRAVNPDVPETRFVFEGIDIRLRWSCGLFITMNPGYAGRTALPDNLKSMFRPISMMVPDSGMIAEILLMGVGFGQAKVLAKKIFTCYQLCEMQLSKQPHYDFKLRALVSIIRNAGKKREASPTTAEEDIIYQASMDMNVAKMTADDLPLFLAIMGDLFPGIDAPPTDYGRLKEEVIADLKAHGYQPTDFIVTKTLELYENKTSRHSIMTVGNSQGGKSVAYNTLQRAMIACAKKDVPGFVKVHTYPMNPKAVTLDELYGAFNVMTNEWTDGILSSIMRTVCADEKPDQKWIVFDGPVQTDWIESMNSVMDDNKLLTLINGERISMPEQVSLLFECQDLGVASPATVSRAGFVFFDTNDLGWDPYYKSWLDRLEDQSLVPDIQRCVDRFVSPALEFVTENCVELVPTTPCNKIISLCNLLGELLTDENGIPVKVASEERTKLLEKWFLFSIVWSIGGGVDQPSRKKVDNFLREMEGNFPAKDTVYEYAVDVKTKTWVHWESRLKNGWSFPMDTPFYKIMVPTVDTLRYAFVLNTYLKAEKPALVVGPVGTGKTQMVQSVLDTFDQNIFSCLNVNMSSQTSSQGFQEIIEAQVEKRTKGVFVPLGNKKMFMFIDDLNMPAKGEFGDQPPLELLRQWMDYTVWYDREKQVVKSIRNVFPVAAMGPPGGGRTVISMRLQSRFSLINMTFPSDTSLYKIFGTIFNQRLQGFDESVKPLVDQLNKATLQIYKKMFETMLPTPSKMHYLFNLRDISKVFQGLFRADKDFHDTTESLQRLWVHEIFRVFGDRLTTPTDNVCFQKYVEEALGAHCNVNLSVVCPDNDMPIFCDWLREGAKPVYEDAKDFQQLKNVVDEKLEDYNNTPGYVAMDLVLFKYCVEHITRISRVIQLERGNMLLIGVGGSGRKSVARLAASILEYKIFMIEVTKTYRIIEFREDLKTLYRQTGVDNKPTMFLFDDTQAVDESMFELMNNILSSGEVAKLFPPEELDEVINDLTPLAKREGIEQTPVVLYRWFIERVRNNLHIVLSMSPVGEAFRNRMRMYPSLINCNTIDYFSPWPEDALLAVAEKFMDDVNFDVQDAAGPADVDGDGHVSVIEDKDHQANIAEAQETLKRGVSSVFSLIHQSVVSASSKMQDELKRTNYVTPINYLELVLGYKELLAEKRKELGDAADKLSNGLEKIDDTRIKVAGMQEELKVTQGEVAVFQKECEEYLVVIVQQKKEADEQQKSVEAKAQKISVEAKACSEMAAAAQADLDEALPALDAAVEALNSLNKGDITEIKSYTTPPKLVGTVLEAVMILRKNKPDWASAKKDLAASDFIKQLIEFDKDHISEATRKKIEKYTTRSDFTPDVVGKVSTAARSLCMWVRAMEVYARIFKVVEPKKAALKNAEENLAAKQAALAKEEAALKEVTERVAQLQSDYEAKLKVKDDLAAKAEMTALKLSRAEQLVSGLAGERTRWDLSIKVFRKNIKLLVGDCIMAAGAMSYLGPFISVYRNNLVTKKWKPKMLEFEIPHSPGFDVADFLAKPVDVRFWNIQGLPADNFSTENGVIVTRGRRWPLMIDPQGQAIKWIKNMEGNRGLKIIDLQMKDFLRTVETAIQFGNPVLLQGVGEELDPSLEPVLAKQFIKVGGRRMIRLGDKEIDYNPDFKFYITTKMSNPVYGPDISTKVTLVNFAVVLEGLEEQMLGITVRRERPDLEEQKDKLVMNIASGKKTLVELEDKILDLLANAKGSLLDDVTLLDTLNASKTTSIAVNEQLEIAATTEKEIDAAREGYRGCANRAAVLFFVLNDIEVIDPMYQFALDAYITLFNLSITKAKKSNKLEARIDSINEFHTYAVYRSTCLGLFEKDKLLFSFHLVSKVLESMGKLNMTEYNFFLKGGQVLDRETQVPNPAPGWLSETVWDNITELDKEVPKFGGLVKSIESNLLEWKEWYKSARPEGSPLPGEWDTSCNEMQKMLLLRSFRQDRVAFVATSFIVNSLGQRFVEPPPLDMNAVLGDATPQMPLIFVLSPGVDPTRSLIELAEKKGMGDRLKNLSLGQGQAPIAEKLIEVGRKEGHWIFLANCHLSLSWMPRLAKIVETLESEPPHEDFLIWLSSSPSPNFPISILQAGIKMTTEPPKGLKANQKRLYASLTEDQFETCHASEKYKKLMQALVFFHSIIIVRRKFQMLGWNVIYPFNDSDFIVSESILSLYLDEYDETPWEAMRYLIAGVMYGGHVTDDQDRRLMLTYINELICPEALETGYNLSKSDAYTIIDPGPLQSYADLVAGFPNVDPPEAFGQHPNADISSMIRENTMMLGTLVGLQPAVVSAGGQSNEDKVYEMAHEMEGKIPPPIDTVKAQKLFKGDTNPLTVVLFQEIDRYNVLLVLIKQALINVQKGVKGLVVMSADLEEVFTCMLSGVVPPAWKHTFPSQKPLAAWARDLIERINMFRDWAERGAPPTVFWMSAFSFPTGFLTAVLQNTARGNSVPIDLLTWEFHIQNLSEENIKEPPSDGQYIKGLYIEGAAWDNRQNCIIEANPMELFQPMPIIWFKPVENAKSKAKKGSYSCPCYYYPNRAGEGGAKAWSYVISVELKGGDYPAEHWIKEGVALLMSLDN